MTQATESRFASLCFTSDDQDLFARLSGDYNPLHVDPVAARRLPFGGLVVHGIHALLRGLNVWLGGMTEPIRLRTLTVTFRSPIIINESVEVVPRRTDDRGIRIDLFAWLTASNQIVFHTQPFFKSPLRITPGTKEIELAADLGILTKVGQAPRQTREISRAIGFRRSQSQFC